MKRFATKKTHLLRLSARNTRRSRFTGWKTVVAACVVALLVTGSSVADTSPTSITPQPADSSGATALAAAMNSNATVGATSFQTTPSTDVASATGTNSVSLAGFPIDGSTFAILTNGDATLADQSGSSSSVDLGGSTPSGRGDTAYDVTVLAVPITVPTGSNCVSFDFRFLSEEYPDYVGTEFNDAFIAEMDTSDWTTSGSEITAPQNFALDPDGKVISVNSSGIALLDPSYSADTTYNAATPILLAAKEVAPGEHTLYLSVFDQGDHILDSAVFLDNLRAFHTDDCSTGHVVGVVLTGSTLTGTVTDPDGNPVAQAPVESCRADGTCVSRFTNNAGVYQAFNLAAGDYTVTAHTPADHNYTDGHGGPVAVSGVPGASFTQNVALGPSPGAPPAGTTITNVGTEGGIPVVYWDDPLTITTEACSGGTGSYQIVVGGSVVRNGPMTESPSGSGHYVGTAAAVYPNHGDGQVTITIHCPGGAPDQNVDFGIYIDPSGTVVDAGTGLPISGATVTLLRSDSASGPFVSVLNGSAVMSAANRTNPDTTGSDGSFGWDVIAGYYKVQASSSTCGSVESAVLNIPPAVTNLVLSLPCPHTLTVSKSGSGAGTVTSSPTGINCGITCAFAFPTGTQVTLTAAPSAGSVFDGWSGGGCSGTSSSCKVTVSGDASIGASFKPETAASTGGPGAAGLATGGGGALALGKISAHLTKTSFKRSQAAKVKLLYSFSPESKSFAYLLSSKKKAKWLKVLSVGKTGSFKGAYTMTVKQLFGGKAIKAGRYRLKLSADANSNLLVFRVT